MRPPEIDASTEAERRQYIKDTFPCIADCDMCGLCTVFKGKDPELAWKDVYNYAESTVSVEMLPSIFLNTDNFDKEFDALLSFAVEKDAITQRRNGLLQNWKETFLHMDMNTYRTKYDEANKKFLGKGRALNNLAAEIQSFASFQVMTEQIPAILADIEMYQKQEAAFESNKKQIPFEWKQILEKYSTVQSLQSYKQAVMGEEYR